jgi:hypothetical protein
MFPPRSPLSSATAFGASPSSRDVFCQVTSRSVVEATYFGVLLRCAVNGTSLGPFGQKAAIFSYVLRPNR